MSSPTQITTGTAQQAQQESRPTSPQQNHAASEPPKGNQSDHPFYNAKRPPWTQGLSAKGNPARRASTGTAPDAAAISTDEAGMPQEGGNVTAQSELPLHIRCLEEPDQKTYIDLWKQLPDIPAHWSKKALSTEERHDAMANIDIRQQLDDKSDAILKSRLADGNSPQARLDAEPLLKTLAQSKASLNTLWGALQTNRAIFGALRAKL